MASAEGPARAHGKIDCCGRTRNNVDVDVLVDRHGRRRPFASWMKRLTSLKSSHTDTSNTRSSQSLSPIKSRKADPGKNTPCTAYTTTPTDYIYSDYSPSASRHDSFAPSKTSHEGPGYAKSKAPTLATTAETTISDTGRSGAGTSVTIPRTEGDRDSTFSSPAPSVRSLTTTLTTLQSTTPALNGGQQTQVSPAYPSTQPASAVPPHLVPHSHPVTHHMATANNVLTDDASILTLASSSKRRRRNSLDTNASIKALAPASMFGNSRESLPLSMLSSAHAERAANMADNVSLRDTASSYYPYPRSGSAMNVERTSLISASGVTAPVLASERNSYVSQKPTGDGASIRSGLLGGSLDLYHGRNDSLGGISITRDRFVERDRGHSQDYFRDTPMVTAPTSPVPV